MVPSAIHFSVAIDFIRWTNLANATIMAAFRTVLSVKIAPYTHYGEQELNDHEEKQAQDLLEELRNVRKG